MVPLPVAALGGPWRVAVERTTPCARCDGTGWRLAGRACPACQGRGTVAVGDEVAVLIPAATANNGRVKHVGAGGPGTDGGPPGDLWVTVKVLPHPTFTRRALDLWTEVTVDGAFALAGGSLSVPTLTEAVMVEVPPGTREGRVIRVLGAGVPGPRGRLPGDLQVRVHVR